MKRKIETPRIVIEASVFTLVALLIIFCMPSRICAAPQNKSDNQSLSTDDPAVRVVMDVQDRHTKELMEIPNVNGTGTGLSDDGSLAIIVFTRTDEEMNALPDRIEGISVIRRVIGEVTPAIAADENTSLGKSFSTEASTTAARPSSIGTSTGNWNDCGAGTIGARMKSGNSYFVLSCNHVFARMNAASMGELIVQPGRGDVGCAQIITDTIGRLADYQPITYGSANPNAMDAALVRINPMLVEASTPVDGYGAPSSTTANASMNMNVKKYGKRTGLTTGYVSALNVSISVTYSTGTAYFSGQIVIQSPGTFADGGDSGSLVVKDGNTPKPVGLVFAKSGLYYTFVTPINTILSRFNVIVDDGEIAPLPVELSSFSGLLHGEDVHLKWRTETELQNFGFFIQRSGDKQEWEDVAFVIGAGESYAPRDYSYIDPAISAFFRGSTLHYRLLQLDRDGTTTLSSILSINQRPAPNSLQVFPHPVRTEATLQLSLAEASAGTLNVYDAYGRRLSEFTQTLDLNAGTQLIPLSMTAVLPGNYFIEFHSTSGVIRKHILVTR